jgi:hypothetical protein
MPSVSHDSLSFLIDGARTRATRLSIVGAAFDAALIDPARWAAELARLRHAGFNTVVIRVPWAMHEPTPDRFILDGACDLRRAIRLAGAEGLRVALRIGPCVGGSFARGGLPVWLRDLAGPNLRQMGPEFLARVTKFWRALAPQFVDLQATRNGPGEPRPVVAVGIEDDWRSLDGEVGEPYFSALVRYAREVGIDVPLFTANKGWYTHEGVIDAWRGATDIARTVDELRELHPSMPPLLLFDAGTPAASVAAASVAARSDFACEVVAMRHLGATSARGLAQTAPQDLFPLRRSLVFATSFAEHLASMLPVERAIGPAGAMRTTLEAADGARIEVTVDDGRPAAPARRNGRTSSKDDRKAATNGSNGSNEVPRAAGAREIAQEPAPTPRVDFRASNLPIGASRLEQCGGSLVALFGDIVVVAAAARTKVPVKIDGSAVQLAAPADGGAPKVTRVRGLRMALVTLEMAQGVGLANEGIEFVDRDGVVVARIARDGSVERAKAHATKSTMRSTMRSTGRSTGRSTERASRIPLVEAGTLVEAGFLDGTHPRFARVAQPRSLGAYGLASMHGFYCARFRPPSAKGREVLGSSQGGIASERRSLLRARGNGKDVVWVLESRADMLHASGGHRDERIGAFGPLFETVALKGVKAQLVETPDFDATRIGRFAWGYDARGGTPGRRTVRWTFAARTRPVIVRLPEAWTLEGHDALGHALRLNGELLDVDLRGRTEIVLDGARLSPMRPAPTAKGEKPAKGRNVKLVPGENELVIDLAGDVAIDDAMLRGLLKETRLLDAVADVAAEWSFARVEPPASWSLAAPAGRRAQGGGTSRSAGTMADAASGAPAWFRWTFRIERVPTAGEAADQTVDDTIELAVEHAPGSVATILVNGATVMVLDGASGARIGTAKRPLLRRTLVLPSSMLRSGENEILAFEPDGARPMVSLHVC